jgi:hypothetical protein
MEPIKFPEKEADYEKPARRAAGSRMGPGRSQVVALNAKKRLDGTARRLIAQLTRQQGDNALIRVYVWPRLKISVPVLRSRLTVHSPPPEGEA